jgi:hypothetical protein
MDVISVSSGDFCADGVLVADCRVTNPTIPSVGSSARVISGVSLASLGRLIGPPLLLQNLYLKTHPMRAFGQVEIRCRDHEAYSAEAVVPTLSSNGIGCDNYHPRLEYLGIGLEKKAVETTDFDSLGEEL